MKANEIRAKLEKAQEVVAKKEATLERHIAKSIKIQNEIIARGWNLEAGKYQKIDTEEHEDCYWTFCDYANAVESIKDTKEAIKEKKAIVSKWAVKLEEALKEEKEADELPEVLKTFRNEVVKMWNRWDKEKREEYRNIYKQMQEEDTDRLKMNAYREFIKRYKYTGYEFMRITDEEINKTNTRNAEALVMNLWTRVKEIVGMVTDYEELIIRQGNEWEGIVINGFVKGTNGTALVETIGAGGYNIQKFHYRTLVKKYQ